MMRSVTTRVLYDKRWFMLGWSLALSAMALLMITMFPSLKDGMSQIAASMPESVRGLVGDVALFAHLDTYLSSQLYDIRIPVFLMIMATVLGQNLSIASEEKGVLRTLLATKLSRTRLYAEQYLAAMIIFAGCLLITGAVTFFGVALINEAISLILIIKLGLLSLLLAAATFSFVYGAGMALGSRSVCLLIGVGMIILSVILEAGRAVDWLDPVQYVSLLHYYDAGKLLTTGIQLSHLLVMISSIVVSVLITWLLFRRRDVS